MDEKIPTFLAFTGVEDESIAQRFLESTGGDLEYAVQLYMESGQHAQQPTASGISDDAVPRGDSPSDEELAKRLQEEAYGQEQQVREADSNVHRHETLMDSFGGGIGFHGMHSGFASRPSDMFGQRQQGIFNQRFGYHHDQENVDEEEDDDDDEEYHDADVNIIDDSDDEESRPLNRRRRLREVRDEELTSTQRRLAALFRPPFDIITMANLDMAKQQGKQNNKWILINIQDSSEFQSQVMNRDFWSNAQIKQIIKTHFIFLQYQQDSPNGENYINFYHVDSFPHLAILDPLTGERVLKWQDGVVPDIQGWVKEVEEFLDRFSLLPNSKNPLVTHDVKIDPDSLTEEQQVELAMKQSMLESNGHDESNAIVIDESDEEQDEPEIEEEPIEEPSDPFDSIKPVNHSEPDSPPFTRVQIRFSNGKRLIRKLNPQDTILTLFEWLKYILEQQTEEEYGLSSQDKFTLTNTSDKSFKFIECLHKTIEDANLKNASILLDKD
ncbi:UBX domain-containing protein 5 [Spathaspora sp. JA1]|nr:UBX domain-containing protein 5 [Spathaspora sp. JA1]